MPKKAAVTGEASDSSPSLERFCSKYDMLEAVMNILAKNAGITEQDLTDMHLLVGHKVILRRVLSTFTKSSASATAHATSLTAPTTSDIQNVSPSSLANKVAKIEAEFKD